ncbi:uncharacterized protein PHACADRAFT_91054 [Phanerochaete carnosa HHB-10118-sp]|uniref:Malate dehydrogenase n=1 Tax=Phanerochaete carnosa (strain HHB-10118-sp) TaxID=650164 RepID=K5V4H0_PHACS|nr:uncharacterized protein PHACADRAFT_91054 [Phanerochaete carnosa HHB-10118-sp]EKM57506.1 hypothetical protein PHACADRAFT_91054 [Phanerochaete carnosa HHB-10118-sp]
MVAIKHVLNSALAAAAGNSIVPQIDIIRTPLTQCDVSNDAGRLDFTPINNQIAPPSNLTFNFVGLGFGVQNYTCTQNNNFTNVGAVAELIDVSCLINSTRFDQLPQLIFDSWNTTDEATSIQDFIAASNSFNPPDILAQHFFVPNPSGAGSVSPEWNFESLGNRKFQNQPNAFVVAIGKASIPAPNKVQDVNWLDVVNIGGQAGGQIADEVLRTSTVGGQPPPTCEFGQSQDISVKYASFYGACLLPAYQLRFLSLIISCAAFFGGSLGGAE